MRFFARVAAALGAGLAIGYLAARAWLESEV
jgi:hypothetical protein